MSEEIKEKKFEILNYDELPKWEYGTNKNKINWEKVKIGFVFKTIHEVYGYNEFKLLEYDKHSKEIKIKCNEDNVSVISCSGLLRGSIGNILVKYISHKSDKMTIHTKLPTTENGIQWKMLRKGFIIEAEHIKYGIKRYEFIKYDKSSQKIYLKLDGVECNPITAFRFLSGNISNLFTREDSYSFTNKFKIINKLPMCDGKIMWKYIKIGTIFHTEHYKYGYNDFKFIGFDKDKKNRILIEFKDKTYSILTGNFIKGRVGSILEVKTSEFKIEIGTQFKDDKRDITITDRKKTKEKSQVMKYYKYICNKCGFSCGKHYKNGILKDGFWLLEADILGKGTGCSCCCDAPRVVDTEINSVWKTNRWMCDLGVSEYDAKRYTKSSDEKIKITCPDCGSIKIKKVGDIYRCKSISCTCGDGNSHISKYIKSILDQLELNYQTEVKYGWNKYINPKNNKLTQASIDYVIYYDGREIPLEADGGFHRKDNSMNGQTKEMSEHIDKQRDENCLKYLGEETIRISDEGDIKENILNSKLNELFDLSQVDWLKCEEFALKNIVKQVCEYWNQKEEWENTIDVGIRFNLNRVSIINYLKKGAKLGWCNYNPKEEMRKNGSENGKSAGKPVEIFKKGVSLGVFESVMELDRKSQELFGIKLLYSGVCQACRGDLNTYKGFTFKYI